MPAGQIHLPAKNGCYIFKGLLKKKRKKEMYGHEA